MRSNHDIVIEAKRLLKEELDGEPITVADLGILMGMVDTRGLGQNLLRQSKEPGSLIEHVTRRKATYRWIGPKTTKPNAVRAVIVEVPKSTPSPDELLISQSTDALHAQSL